MTMSERDKRIRQNVLELRSDPNRTLCPGQVPTRNAVFRVRNKRRIETFSILGDRSVPHSAIAFAVEIGGEVHAIWDEK